MKFSRLFGVFLTLVLLSVVCLLLLQYFNNGFLRLLLYAFFLLGMVTFIYMYVLKVMGKLRK